MSLWKRREPTAAEELRGLKSVEQIVAETTERRAAREAERRRAESTEEIRRCVEQFGFFWPGATFSGRLNPRRSRLAIAAENLKDAIVAAHAAWRNTN